MSSAMGSEDAVKLVLEAASVATLTALKGVDQAWRSLARAALHHRCAPVQGSRPRDWTG